jgi:hypothetical protein
LVKATVCKTVYRWFESIPWDHPNPLQYKGFPWEVAEPMS